MAKWTYSDKVKDHFMNPRNILREDNEAEYHGIGLTGNIKCGDEMMVYIRLRQRHRQQLGPDRPDPRQNAGRGPEGDEQGYRRRTRRAAGAEDALLGNGPRGAGGGD